MNRKTIGIIVAYTIVMASLLFVTFGLNWNPSGYDYKVEGDTLTIERGMIASETQEVNIQDKQSTALLFYTALSKERGQWNIDLTMIGLLLPFILLLFVPEKQPLKETVPRKWYRLVVISAAVLYLAYSITQHVTNISLIQTYVERLLS
ncbi:hypothetical protein LCM20_10715 [Halobacillus litoralis]|uniref:hypothetical protein n=1 Tax=Halobacillus litoralis TaxID=45668 RepID=UPI001CD574B2|nr:hypothetical protein [Halobacillus litoralis]MCA0971063.1 hypothetical protein [Halobacillus litoralis]